jgi:hypothetical protein
MQAAFATVAATVAASVVVLVAPVTVAHADPGDTLEGGCAFYTTHLAAALTGGQNEGVIADVSASQEAAGGPSVATVDCWIVVNGIEAPGTRITASGNGIQANAAPVTFTARDADAVEMCQQVTFADGSTWASPDGTNPFCPIDASPQFPPQVVFDELQGVLGVVDCVTGGQICTPTAVDGQPADVGARPVAAAIA